MLDSLVTLQPATVESTEAVRDTRGNNDYVLLLARIFWPLSSWSREIGKLLDLRAPRTPCSDSASRLLASPASIALPIVELIAAVLLLLSVRHGGGPPFLPSAGRLCGRHRLQHEEGRAPDVIVSDKFIPSPPDRERSFATVSSAQSRSSSCFFGTDRWSFSHGNAGHSLRDGW